MPQVSIILSSLNHARFLPEAIESVLQQTFSDFELFIIDDASEDDSWDVIRRYQDSRIIAIRNPQRMRGAYGFNKIIQDRAQGEFIAIHHSDDVWAQEKLEKQIDFLKAHPEVAVVFTHVQLIDELGQSFADEKHFYYSLFDQQNRSRFEWLNKFFLRGNCLCHPSALIRRSELLQTGLYDRRLGQLTDFDLWVRLCFQSEIWILEEKLTKFRILDNEGNQSGNRKESKSRIGNEWPLILQHYLQYCDEKSFSQIFPNMQEPRSENHWQFLLAMMALKSDDEVKKKFGLNLLYTLYADSKVAKDLYEKHNFGYNDLIALSGEVDPFYNEELLRLRSGLKVIKESWWWKFCTPIRVLEKVCKNLIIQIKSR